MHTSDVESVIRSDTSVVDCRVLPKKALSGELELVAYVVPQRTFAAPRLRELMIARLPAERRPRAIVCIPSAPLTPDGAWDVSALEALPVLDDDVVRAGERSALAQTGVKRAAAIPVAGPVVERPLHLSDIVADWSRPTFRVPAAGVGEALKADVSTLDAPPAISDGGELRIPSGSPSVLGDMLRHAASVAAPAGMLYYGVDGREDFATYEALRASAHSILTGLRSAGLSAGDHVVFQFRHNRDFLETFWACILGGMVPVPTGLAPTYGELNAAVRRLGDATTMLGRAVVATTAEMVGELRGAAKLLGVRPFEVLAVDSMRDLPAASEVYRSEPDDIALMMLTSGSTGVPKGVPLSHRNLISRTLGSCAMNGFGADAVTLNWMPLDHVAGLIYFHLRDVYLACRQIHVATDLVLRDPLLWLDLLARYRANVTFAPNFAFGLVAGVAEQMRQRRCDLSSVKMILNGGEAIVASTARKFVQLLATHGLAADVMRPAWGMSEISSGITYWHAFRLDTTADDDPHVKVGRPIPGDRLRIVDEADAVLNEGQIGHLQVVGATVFRGYYGNAQPLEETFTSDGWFRTGDLGRLDDGVLTITGRAKDVIIINGANYSGPAIEAAIEELAGVACSFTAACAVADPRADGGEGLAVFFVAEADDDDTLAQLLKAIRQRVVQSVGISPAFVVPLARADIPKTSIGKIQRSALRKALEGGAFDAALKRVDILSANANTIPAWFFRRAWHRKRAVPANPLAAGETVLVVGGDDAIAAAIAAELARRSVRTVRLSSGGGYARVAADIFDVDPASAADFTSVLATLEREGARVQRIVYLANYVPQARRGVHADDHRVVVASCATLAACVRGIAAVPGATMLVAVSNGVDNVIGDEVIDCAHAALVPLVHSIAQEHDGVHALHVDVGGCSPAEAATIVLAELESLPIDREVAYRQRERLVPILLRIVPSLDRESRNVLVRGGTYLISGGLGGIGTHLATFLLQRFDARVLLVGRAALPPRERRDAKHGVDDANLARVAAMIALESISPDVRYASVDVTDADALQRAVTPFIAQSGGRLDAIFHLAGEYRECALANETPETLAGTLAAKIAGAGALLALARARGNAPFIAFSSVTSLFGGAVVGAYAAANRYLDALARHAGHDNCYSLDWSSWRQTGLNQRYAASEPLRAMGVIELSVDQALTSLRVALSESPGEIVIGLDASNPFVARHAASVRLDARVRVFCEIDRDCSPQLAALPDVVDRYGVRCAAAPVPLDALPLNEVGEVDRAALEQIAQRGRAFRAPSTPTEHSIADIWRRVLGLDVVGADASFFELGGQSLLATQLIAALNATFGVRLTLRDVFGAPTIGAQAARIETESPSEGERAVTAADRDKPIPLGPAQQRLWFLDRVHPNNTAFHIPAIIRFRTMPEPALVERCLQTIVRRHETLRTTFPVIDGEPCQMIAANLPLGLAIEDVPAGTTFDALAEAEARAPFDLANGPLIRARLVRLAHGGGALLVTMHHIVSDGWSMKVFFREFLELYRDPAGELPPLRTHYADFTQWQHELQRSARQSSTQLEYWRRQLAGNLHGFSLPTDRTRPPIQTYAGGRVVATIPAGLTRRVRELARDEGVTLFVALLAAYKAMLARYAQQDDIVVGTVVANRDRAELAPLIGFVVNVLVLRSDFGGDPRFVEALCRVHRVVLDGYANHDVSFEVLVDELQPQRDMSRSPLFQIAFDLRDPEIVSSAVPDVSLGVMEPDLRTCQYDIHLTIEERAKELVAYWQYNSDLFDEATIARMARNYETLLANAASQPDTRLSALALISPDERELARQWNRTSAPFAAGRRVHELFEDVVDRSPDAEALVFGGTTLLYAELDRLANRWAHKLRAMGVDRDVVVGVSMDRCVDLVVAVLATLKAGGAFLPLDPAYPIERLQFMVRDSKIRLLITESRLAGRFSEPGLRIVEMDTAAADVGRLPIERPRTSGSANDLAYVIYTSGSTGVPKGVLVEHHGWCNVSRAQQDVFGLRPGMRVLQFASLSFDACAFEIAMALCGGGTLVLADSNALMPGPSLERLLRDERIAVITVPPSALGALRTVAFADLEVITVAGEACPAELVERWAHPPARFFNLYGPTEATIWASYAECAAGSDKPPPIGKPVPNMQLHVLDSHANLLPIGMPGELYIGGEGVTRGYLDRPDLTAERFIADPFSEHEGARLYRSGDLVRRNAAGQVEFLGRVDHQVKLRGFRIELGEIETLLCRHDSIKEAVVVARESADRDRALVAYVAPVPGRTIAVDALRAHLRGFLPAFMIPARIVVMEQLPLTPNGKIDRAALPDPDRFVAEVPAPANLPQNDLERAIAAVWQDVLDLRHVDRQQNFFDAGGHSLNLAQVHARLTAELDIPIDLVQLFQYPSVSSLAAYLAGARNQQPGSARPVQAVQAQQRMSALAERQRAVRRDERKDT